MSRFLLTALSILTLAVAPADGVGQETPIVVPGDRVRVTSTPPDARVVGRFQAMRQGAVTLLPEDGAGPAAVPVEAITRFERSAGTDRGTGFVRGALLGVGTALIGGLILSALPTDGGGANMAMAGALLVGTPVGIVAGGAIGAAALAPERWELVPLPPEQR